MNTNTNTNTNTLHKHTKKIKIVQLNLHHCREAMAELCRYVVEEEIDIALLQEPYAVNGRVAGLGSLGGDLIYCNDGESNPRTCIFASRNATALELIKSDCYRDLVCVEITIQAKNKLKKRVAMVAAYLPSECAFEPPTREMEEVISKYQGKNIPVIVGCDANAHHTVWGSTDCNRKGDLLLEYISTIGMGILNEGNTPTFVTRTRREVLDITFASDEIIRDIQDWKVDEADSLSDHRRITFNLTSIVKKTMIRNARKTNWARYKDEIKTWKPSLKDLLVTEEEIESETTRLETALREAYHSACPLREIKPGKGQPWWTKELTKQRKRTRRALRVALNKGDEESWNAYRDERNKFKSECRREHRNSWRAFCENIEKHPDAARMVKTLAKVKACNLGSIRKGDQLITNPEDILKEMLKTHFPECVTITEEGDRDYQASRGEVSKETLVTEEQLIWSIRSFQPYKAAGPDEIFPKLLQSASQYIIKDLTTLYNSCINMKYIPRKWRETKAIFIPKPGKPSYQEAKAYRCISLSSFLLKTLEKIIDRTIRLQIERHGSALHHNQHAYTEGKSTETALHSLVTRVNRSIDHKEYALGCFFDIEGAFDRATPESIEAAINREGISKNISGWVKTLLGNRYVKAELAGSTVTIKARRGFPQGGCLSPLLWCLLIDELVKKLNRLHIYTQMYSDDGVLLITGKVLSTICNIMNRALKVTLEWCRSKGLNLNPDKTKCVLFTNKRKIGEAEPVCIEGITLEIVKEFRYLGVTLDSKLTFKKHIVTACSRAKTALMQCKGAIGRTWGTRPAVVLWIYKAIILPRILHGALVWWHKARLKTNKRELDKVQRLAMLMVTGAMRSTPTMALETMLGLNPLDLEIKKRATEQWFKLKSTGLWKGNRIETGHASINSELEEKLSMILANNDLISKERIFDKKYRIHIDNRETWKPDTEGTICYTDGSRKESTKLSGSGVHIQCDDGTERNSTAYLGKYASVFQAEIYAIIECVDMLEHIKEVNK